MDTSKIIKGVVGGGRYTVTAPIVKEDYGLYLKIEGLELPSTYEVDFSNDEHSGSSVTMIGNADGVLIPNQFISSGKDIFAFLYHVGDNYGRTIYKFRIPNKLRPDRTDEEPTPEEQSVIDQTISALNNAVEQTSQDVISAYESAQNASVSADRAERSESASQLWAETAENYSDSAEQSASQANAAATASAQSAQSAETARQETTFLVAEAQRYADASEQSATNAQTYALSANAASGTAENFADVASRLASQAQVSANTASEKASEASGYASTASTKASEASASAVSASGYATQAESAKTASQIAQGLAEEARDDSEQIKSDVQDLADGIDTKLVDVEDGILKAFPTDTASGAVASFTDGADGLPLKSLVVDINPVQDTSGGDPSPENICPISGWTGANVVRSGINIWNPNILADGSGRYTVNQDKSITINKSDTRAWSALPRFYLKAGTYTISKSNTLGAFMIRNDDASTQIAQIPNGSSQTSFTLASDTWCRIRFGSGLSSGDYPMTVNFQMELGSTKHDYEPYTATTLPITWTTAGTVYGGTLDVTTGVLTVDRASVDLGTLNWVMESSGVFRINQSIRAKITSVMSEVANMTCSIYPTASQNDMNASSADKCIGGLNWGNGVQAKDSAYTDAATFKTAMNGVQLVYELAEPQTYQLTPQQINSLLGQNNIWADTGNISVEYCADTEMYIEKVKPVVNVDDVQINGTSIINDGVANVPIASTQNLGVVKTHGSYGLATLSSGVIRIDAAPIGGIKGGTDGYHPVTPNHQHSAAFYGLAKAAGDTTQSQSSNAVGNYTEDAKSAISEMLGGSVTVSGTTPTVTAKSGIRYVCGEVSTLDITTPSSGIIDVIFTSGATATVLTVTPPTGMTMKWANGFDPTQLDANTVYEINIMDGCLGVCGKWT